MVFVIKYGRDLPGIPNQGAVAGLCNSLSLQPEVSGGQGSIHGRALSSELHDKGLGTQLTLTYLGKPSAWR